ncbi:MAG: hypothetical protein QOK28_3402 [Actinomycetota bacterium]|jgi:hypothetical protein
MMVSGDVRDRVLELLRAGLSDGHSDITEYEAAIDAALHATSEAELAELVRKYAPPVTITPPERCYSQPFKMETLGLFSDIRMRGRWQVARDLTVKTGPSKIVLDFTDAEFDDWDVKLKTETGLGDITLIVPRGVTVKLVDVVGPVTNKLEESTPGYPVIELTVKIGFGRLRLKHPRAKRSAGRALPR